MQIINELKNKTKVNFWKHIQDQISWLKGITATQVVNLFIFWLTENFSTENRKGDNEIKYKTSFKKYV